MSLVITIDGPSGAGKGTVSQAIAKALNWHFLDSGAMYRLCGLAVLQQAISFEDVAAIEALAQQLNIDFKVTESGLETYLDGVEVSKKLRTEETARAASQVAAMQGVRSALLTRQQAFAKAPGLLADGRDMGTVVFPDAPLKIYLTATAEERAQRRYKQLQQAGQSVNLAAILKDIEDRDTRDMGRKTAPLKAADDAITIDSTNMSIDAVINTIMEHAKARKLA